MADRLMQPPVESARGQRAIALEPLALTHVWNVRGDASSAPFVDALTRVLGIAPFARRNGSARGVEGTLLSLGPRSWLWIADAQSSQPAFDAARRTLNDADAALFDVSSSYVAWRVAGSAAARVLNRGCPLDLDPDVFAPGDCAQSLLGHVPVLIHRRDDEPAFVVAVARSYARDAWALLCASAATDGYGLIAATP